MSTEPVLLVTGDVFARHNTGDHPENQDRLEAVIGHLREIGLYERCQVLAPRSATVGELTLVHDSAYVDLVRSTGEEGGGWLDYDTLITPGTYEAACHAVGAGLVAAERIHAGDLRRDPFDRPVHVLDFGARRCGVQGRQALSAFFGDGAVGDRDRRLGLHGVAC